MIHPFRFRGRHKFFIVAILTIVAIVLAAAIGLDRLSDNSEIAPPPTVLLKMPIVPKSPSIGMTLEQSKTLEKDLAFPANKTQVLIRIAKSDVTLDCAGHKIKGNGLIGIAADGVDNITIKDCHIDGPFLAIRADKVNNFNISGGSFTVRVHGAVVDHGQSVVFENLDIRPLLKRAAGYALEIYRTESPRVTGCELSGFDQGVLFYGVENFTASNNKISQITETGIGAFQTMKRKPTAKGQIEGNDIRQTFMGLEIHAGSNEIDIKDNKISDCKIAVMLDEEEKTPRFHPISNIRFEGNTLANNKDTYIFYVKDQSTISKE